ncbi:DUF7009 family protein [Pontibacter actiniarum]|nr:hypothetical protein [Pontibacter actiniarum]
MKDNSIRLRLMQQEVEQFKNKGKVVTTSQLGPSLAQAISYSLLKDEESEVVSASFIANNIKVLVPRELAKKWTDTDQVGIEGQMLLSEGEYLYILIEKDFKCLQERPNEDESDAFPNPLDTRC